VPISRKRVFFYVILNSSLKGIVPSGDMNYAVPRASLSNPRTISRWVGLVAIATTFLTSYQLSNRHSNTVTVSKTNIKYNSEARVISPRRWPTLNPLSELELGVVYRRTGGAYSISQFVSVGVRAATRRQQPGSLGVWAADRLIALCASSHNMSWSILSEV
jgi:hypothetical protein